MLLKDVAFLLVMLMTLVARHYIMTLECACYSY